MKKYFVSSDIHGFYDEWMKSLDRNGFDINNPDHIIVVCGDLLDRGTQPFKVLDFIMKLPEERTILITGNHEILMDELIERGFAYNYDISNGTHKTLQTLLDDMPYWRYPKDEVKKKLNETNYYKVRAKMKNYAEIGDYVFVHGWIPCTTDYQSHNEEKIRYNKKWRYATQENWNKSMWINGMKAYQQGATLKGKTIVCGHYHCSWGWSHLKQEREEFPNRSQQGTEKFNKAFEPFKAKGILAIDACTAYSGIVNCVVIEI